MIKTISRFKITNFQVLHKTKFNKNNKVPYSEKPLVAYMTGLFLEPERRNSSEGGLFGLFSNLFSHQLDNKQEKIEKKESLYETKKEVLEEKLEEKLEDKLEAKLEKKVEKYEPYAIFKDIAPPRNKNILQAIVEKFSKALSLIGSSLSNFKGNIIDIKNNIVYNIKNKKSIAESKKLYNARNDFKNKLQEYKNMFDNDDIIPDLSEFSKYRYVSLAELIKLTLVLEACIKHQEAINKLKSRYCRGASKFSSSDDDRNLGYCKLQDLPPELINKPNLTRKDLIILYNIFMKNSKTIEAPIKSFHNVSKSFFKRTKSNMEEIFEIKKRWFWAEKIPKINIIPKAIRITGQINLTRRIMRDYREIMGKYIKNGVNITVVQYGNQYNIINNCINTFKNDNLNNDKIQFADKLLYKMQNAKADRVSTYARLFDAYAAAGYNINNFCNNVRLKGGIGLGLKALFTFFTPF